MRKKLKPDEAAEIFARLQRANPAPQTELHFKNPYTLLVAVILSAQATDVGVNRATGPLFEIASTPEEMVALGEARLGDYIRTIGLWRAKAKNVIAMSKILIERHGGAPPRTREELEVLPGVGRKTANVVLNAAFGAPTIAVDTHVFRVANRTGLAPGKTPLAVERGLEAIVPEAYRQHAHHWLILHGRYACTARAPKCPACPIVDLCLFRAKTGASAQAKPRAGAARGTRKSEREKPKRSKAAQPGKARVTPAPAADAGKVAGARPARRAAAERRRQP
jgi:endonuclease-3